MTEGTTMDETGYNNAAAVWDELRHADDGCPNYSDDSTDTEEPWAYIIPTDDY